MKEKYKKGIDLAAGRGCAELLLRNCRIVNVFSNKIEHGHIAIDNGKIIGVGDYEAKQIIDMKNKFVSPGLIDSHEHMESSMVVPSELARVIVPRGTTTIIADPHEIANVCGLKGIDYMLNATESLPLNVFFMFPSCVPSTKFENSGAILNAADFYKYIDNRRILGLGELMDYPATINGEAEIINKVILADKLIIDGHSPLLTGKELNAYAINGVKTDHECTNQEELMEKLSLGMYIAIREGSAARDLEKLIQSVSTETERRFTFCTDDKHPGDILQEGHIDHNIRKSIKLGLNPISAIRMATLNTAECYNLRDIGAIAPGYDADLIVFEDLEKLDIVEVYKKGKLVAKNGHLVVDIDNYDISEVSNTVNIGNIKKEDLAIRLNSDIAKVIRVTPHSLLTELVVRKVSVDNENRFVNNNYIDVLKLAVIERHKGKGNIGLALIENFQLKGGAIGTTIAHDSHNLIVVGDNDEDMLLVIKELERLQGGIAIASNNEIMESLQLSVAGLMSYDKMEIVSEKLNSIQDYTHKYMGANKEMDVLMTLSFMSLPVIPEVKLTDLGLFNVNEMEFISIDVG